MLAERMDAANAAFQVGYESPSLFIREYNRIWGASASRHHELAGIGCSVNNLTRLRTRHPSRLI